VSLALIQKVLDLMGENQDGPLSQAGKRAILLRAIDAVCQSVLPKQVQGSKAIRWHDGLDLELAQQRVDHSLFPTVAGTNQQLGRNDRARQQADRSLHDGQNLRRLKAAMKVVN
jgi:hypothetical protein